MYMHDALYVSVHLCLCIIVLEFSACMYCMYVCYDVHT